MLHWVARHRKVQKVLADAEYVLSGGADFRLLRLNKEYPESDGVSTNRIVFAEDMSTVLKAL